MAKLKKAIAVTSLTGVIFCASVFMLNIGLEKNFVVQCHKYASFEKDTYLFEASQELVDECANVGVSIR